MRRMHRRRGQFSTGTKVLFAIMMLGVVALLVTGMGQGIFNAATEQLTGLVQSAAQTALDAITGAAPG